MNAFTQQLHSLQQGNSGEPIVILHGLFGNSRNWLGVAKFLSKEHCVYSLDLRNHGESFHNQQMNYEIMAEDVLNFLQHKGLSSTHLIGHSMGGKTAMWLSLNHPDKIKSLVVVDIAPIAYQHSFMQILNGLDGIPLHKINSRQEADEHLKAFVDEQSLRQFLLQNLQFKDEKWTWRINLPALRESIGNIVGFPELNDIKPLRQKSLFIAGQDSDYLSPEGQQLAKQYFPHSRTIRIKQAGHWPHAEQPIIFKGVLKSFYEYNKKAHGKLLH